MPEWAIQLITGAGIAGVFAIYLWLQSKRDSSRDHTDSEYRVQLLAYMIQLTSDFNKTIQNHMAHETDATKAMTNVVDDNTRVIVEMSNLLRKLCEMWEDK